MSRKYLKLGLVALVIAAVVYCVMERLQAKPKGKGCAQRGRLWNGERWQPGGIPMAMNESSNVFQPPLAPVNP